MMLELYNQLGNIWLEYESPCVAVSCPICQPRRQEDEDSEDRQNCDDVENNRKNDQDEEEDLPRSEREENKTKQENEKRRTG